MLGGRCQSEALSPISLLVVATYTSYQWKETRKDGVHLWVRVRVFKIQPELLCSPFACLPIECRVLQVPGDGELQMEGAGLLITFIIE